MIKCVCFRLPIYKLIYKLFTSLFTSLFSLSLCFRLPMLLFLPLTRTYVWWKLHIILLFLNCMWRHAWYAMVVKKSGPLLLLNLAVSVPNLGTLHFYVKGFILSNPITNSSECFTNFATTNLGFFLRNWMILIHWQCIRINEQAQFIDKFVGSLLQKIRETIWCIRYLLKVGQLISKANFEVFTWTKKWTKIFLYFCPSPKNGWNHKTNAS